MDTSVKAIRDAHLQEHDDSGSLEHDRLAYAAISFENHQGRHTDIEQRPEEVREPEDEEVNEETREESGEESDDSSRSLPEIPTSNDFSFDFDKFMESKFANRSNYVEEKVNKRASNVQKLTQENQKLQAELKAMAERLDEIERRRVQLASKEKNPDEE